MNWLTRLRRRPRLDQDLDEEIAFHKAMRAGDPDAPAFGSEVRIKECIRDMWTFAWAEQALPISRHLLPCAGCAVIQHSLRLRFFRWRLASAQAWPSFRWRTI